MHESQNPDLLPFDLEIERTLGRLKQQNMNSEVESKESTMVGPNGNDNDNK